MTDESTTNQDWGETVISVRLPEHRIEELDDRADELGRSRSDLLREGVESVLSGGVER